MRPGLLLLAALAACSTVETSYDFDRSTDFDRLKSYSWLEPKTDGADANPLVRQRVLRALEAGFAAKGYARQEAGGDFQVAVILRSRQRTEVRQSHYGYGYGYGWGGGRVDVYEYEEGSIIVDVIDPRADKAIWRGVARSAVPRNPTPEQTDKLVAEAVTKILENFPPPR